MRYSFHQEELIKVIQYYRSLREHQLFVLGGHAIKERLSIVMTQRQFDAMLRQILYCHGSIRKIDGAVCRNKFTPNPDYLDAIDIMLQLADGVQANIVESKEKTPLIRFALPVGERIHVFAVVAFSVAQQAAWNPCPTERVIFLTPPNQSTEDMVFPYKHFFAVKQEDDTYCFLAGRNE